MTSFQVYSDEAQIHPAERLGEKFMSQSLDLLTEPRLEIAWAEDKNGKLVFRWLYRNTGNVCTPF